MKTLVIVESPTKAKTIAKFLGRDYKVESSMGHVRDLPKSKMGIDIEGGTFLPEYEIPATKKKKVAELRKLAKESDDILFATDEDREGEAISWHLAELLKIKPNKVKRLVFHEITREAIEHSLQNTRPLDINLANAQQARRVLDRLVGYELSPLLWKKIRYGLSAGRVQSVAVHLVVQREKERAKFIANNFFDLLATLATDKKESFNARLVEYDQKNIPTGKDFDEATGKLKNPEKFFVLAETDAKKLADALLQTKPWIVEEVTENKYESSAYPPFITSSLQQEASRKLGYAAKHTMRTAQSLYENGYITYMRTDSTHLSDQAVNAARTAAKEFGAEFVADAPKQYTKKAKLAQEAHEAIRPAGATFAHPSVVAKEVNSDEARLYELIWKRTVATQMKNAQMVSIRAVLGIEKAKFEAKGKRIAFAGYLRAYVEGADDPEAELEHQEITLPQLLAKEIVNCQEVKPESHTTQPPARYTEASLIKKLEQEGVGRPSTYATILDTIVEREYVTKQNSALVPTFTAMIVDDFLLKHFHLLLDVNFTSKMEEDLDRIAEGEEEWQPYIKTFYTDEAKFGLHTEVEKAKEDPTYPVLHVGSDPSTKDEIVIKSGKFGPYLQRGAGGQGNTSSLPETVPPAEINLAKALEFLNRPNTPQVLAVDPATNQPIIFKQGKYGPYLQLGEEGTKKVGLTYGPKNIPISKFFDLQNLTKEATLKLMELPRTLGLDNGEKITTSSGRFGPYIKKGDEFRSLPKDKDVLTVTLEEAQLIFATPKVSRRAKVEVLRELGEDATTKSKVQILNGKYGPYISNGSRTFVSLPKDSTPDDITLEQAIKMLADKKGFKKKRKKT